MKKNLRAITALFVGAVLALAVLTPVAVNALTYRKLPYQVVHAVSDVITYADFAAGDLTEAFPSGIPNGARIVGTMFNIGTAFNNIATLSLGWTGDTSSLAAAGTVLSNTAGSKTGVLFPVLTANRQPLVTLSTYSAIPTAGSMSVTILYYPFTN